MTRVTLDCLFADVCLPDYWGGHSKAHVSVPVSKDTTIHELRSALRSEIAQGAVAGSDEVALMLGSDYVGSANDARATALTKAAYAAINRVKLRRGARKPFPELVLANDDEDYSVYAYFVFDETTK